MGAQMQDIKIRLTEMAREHRCSTDRLLALAEAERIDVFARIKPCTASLKNRRGQAACGSPTRTIDSHVDSVLLPHEICTLRADGKVTVRILREKDCANGVLLPIARGGCELLTEEHEEFFWWLDKPQTLRLSQLYVNSDVKLAEHKRSKAEAPSFQKFVPTASAQPEVMAAANDQLRVNQELLLPTNSPATPPLSRKAIRTLFPELSKTQWRGLFEREKSNGLLACRISGAGEQPLYAPEKLASWIGNHRSEITITGAFNRIRSISVAEGDAQHSHPTPHDPFGLARKRHS